MSGLWHYSCQHRAEGIARDGFLRPSPVIGLVWLTDLHPPEREALGLTSEILACDRLETAWRVLDATGILPWTKVRHHFDPMVREALESQGAKPRHWFVAVGDVPVEAA